MGYSIPPPKSQEELDDEARDLAGVEEVYEEEERDIGMELPENELMDEVEPDMENVVEEEGTESYGSL